MNFCHKVAISNTCFAVKPLLRKDLMLCLIRVLKVYHHIYYLELDGDGILVFANYLVFELKHVSVLIHTNHTANYMVIFW